MLQHRVKHVIDVLPGRVMCIFHVGHTDLIIHQDILFGNPKILLLFKVENLHSPSHWKLCRGKMESLECSVYLGQPLFSVKHMMIYILPVIDNSVNWHSDRVFCQHLWHWSLILLKSHQAIMHWLIYHYLKIIMQNIIKYPIFKILSHIYAISVSYTHLTLPTTPYV